MPSRFTEQAETLVHMLREQCGLSPVVATEIEFYLHGSAARSDMASLGEELLYSLSLAGINTGTLSKERGDEQYEIALLPGHHPTIVAEDTERLREHITTWAAKHALRADFSAKPFAEQPGSGLHVHVHLADQAGQNVFFKQDESYSPILLNAVGGLLATAKAGMPFFAPHRASYARFVPGYNVPVTVSWGANNRTVAIRLPAKPSEYRHLEHRIAGADAEPLAVITTILAGIAYGVTRRITPGDPVFGDASLPIYALEPLPKDLRHAVAALLDSKALAEFLGAELCTHYGRELLKQEY